LDIREQRRIWRRIKAAVVARVHTADAPAS
jgi:hypothetical protein